MKEVIEFFTAHWDEILTAFGAVVAACSAVVKLTPTTKDDEILGKFVSLLEQLSIFNKK